MKAWLGCGDAVRGLAAGKTPAKQGGRGRKGEYGTSAVGHCRRVSSAAKAGQQARAGHHKAWEARCS